MFWFFRSSIFIVSSFFFFLVFVVLITFIFPLSTFQQRFLNRGICILNSTSCLHICSLFFILVSFHFKSLFCIGYCESYLFFHVVLFLTLLGGSSLIYIWEDHLHLLELAGILDSLCTLFHCFLMHWIDFVLIKDIWIFVLYLCLLVSLIALWYLGQLLYFSCLFLDFTDINLSYLCLSFRNENFFNCNSSWWACFVLSNNIFQYSAFLQYSISPSLCPVACCDLLFLIIFSFQNTAFAFLRDNIVLISIYVVKKNRPSVSRAITIHFRFIIVCSFRP